MCYNAWKGTLPQNFSIKFTIRGSNNGIKYEWTKINNKRLLLIQIDLNLILKIKYICYFNNKQLTIKYYGRSVYFPDY